MDTNDHFDFWYAVNNTEIIRLPDRHLETFGATTLHYHLISELMDVSNQVRVREGQLQAHQPQIVTPEAYAETFLEGFGEEAARYIEWLKEHEQDVRILQYGYRLRQQAYSEHVISGEVRGVVDRVKEQVETRNDPLSAIVVGVDDPWDVCLVKLFWEVIRRSARTNIREMQSRHLFDTAEDRRQRLRTEIEKLFLEASRNPELVEHLGKKLQEYDMFSEYEDRFFALIRSGRR